MSEAPLTLSIPGGGALVATASHGSAALEEGVVVLSGRFPSSGLHPGITLAVTHPIEAPRHVWVPHLTPDEGCVMGDMVFRSPAIIVTDAERALALVPDVDDVARADGYRVWMDYNHPARQFTLCAGGYRIEGHVFFVREDLACEGQVVSIRLHVLVSDRPEDVQNPYGMVARWMWDRWGERGFSRNRERPLPVDRHLDRITRWAFSEQGWGEEVWQSFEVGGEPVGAPVFIVDVTRHPGVPKAERRWREPRSVWNQAWFSTQRCANGLLRHARHTQSPDLAERARQMTRLALLAPDRDGLFPSVLRCDEPGGWESARWMSSDRRPPSVSEDACHVADAAFTCRMLLEWVGLTGDQAAMARVRAFAARLLRLQRPNGSFPGWVEPDGRVAAELAEGPESAVAVSLLWDLALDHGRGDLREAALLGTRYLEEVIDEGRWEDFETYYSCAPWGARDQMGERVARNGVYKQNTLSIAWCAEALLRAFRATGEAGCRDRAVRCVDELSLYQAVWDPPFLPAPAHGGFGVMNADSEWNDARQSLFALLYGELYAMTGDRALLARGASALRASFSMLYCPENAALAREYERLFPFFGEESYGFMMENQGHGAGGAVGTFTIYTWGNGSALASAAAARDRFPAMFALAFG